MLAGTASFLIHVLGMVMGYVRSGIDACHFKFFMWSGIPDACMCDLVSQMHACMHRQKCLVSEKGSNALGTLAQQQKYIVRPLHRIGARYTHRSKGFNCKSKIEHLPWHSYEEDCHYMHTVILM